MKIFTLNTGSSSIKYKLIDTDAPKNQATILSGLMEGIGLPSGAWKQQGKIGQLDSSLALPNHQHALEKLFGSLLQAGELGIDGFAHRVVHGGMRFFTPTLIQADVLETLVDVSQLAPLHNPVNILGIETAMRFFPALPHVAIFDTAFHRTMPPVSELYPIALSLSEQYPIRRYGFHGINHQYVHESAAAYLQKDLAHYNGISLHLGNGASACLVLKGKSVDTSMGFTPLAGLMMGTRCGDIDPAIILYLLGEGLSADEISSLLNQQSGLKGFCGSNDMRDVEALIAQGNDRAKLAMDMYVRIVQKTIGAYLSQAPQLDALIFTGGVGENAIDVRAAILTPLQHLGLHLHPDRNQTRAGKDVLQLSQTGIPILLIGGDEEWMMAKQTKARILMV